MNGVGTGVISEVYTFFWNEFFISMTIGERKRVPLLGMKNGSLWEELLLRALNQSPISLPFFLKHLYATTASFGTRFQIPFSSIHFQNIYHHWRKSLF